MSDNLDIAAIDLGSNSFHLLVAHPHAAGFTEVERLKEKVQLLHGLVDGQLDPQAMQRGMVCLARYKQRLASIAAEQIIVMGTQALRQAENGQAYAEQLSRMLGVPIQVISGAQEAQLIYSAVFHRTAWIPGPKVVLDIGGGSTEIALGCQAVSDSQISVGIGCVNLMDRFFDGVGTFADQFAAATRYAQDQLRAAVEANPEFAQALADSLRGGAVCFGTSGTVESILTVLAANGWIDQEITGEAVARLNAALLEDRWVIDAGLPGLAPDRADIFPAGVAILTACLEVLALPALRYESVSLLHGMVYDRLQLKTGGIQDPREDSVMRLAAQCHVDQAQATRVMEVTMNLYRDSASWWIDTQDYADLLRWSAQLHEIGRHVNSRHYHRHGGYIVKHAQLPGFSALQRDMLSLLIRGHRRSMPAVAFRAFSEEHQRSLLRAVALLRLAVILQRSHSDVDSPDVKLTVDDDVMRLDCGPGWLAAHTLSARELEVEVQQLGRAGLQLQVS